MLLEVLLIVFGALGLVFNRYDLPLRITGIIMITLGYSSILIKNILKK
jgi:hypothetical protein